MKVVIRLDRTNLVIIAIGFFVSWAGFYPGFMSTDSLGQYRMSKSLAFNDWHPPVMSWLWSILNLFFKGPEGLLFFHLFIFWSAIYILHDHYKDKRYSWLILSIGFLPWVINFAGVLWKDVGMAYSFLLLMSIGISKVSPGRIAVFLIVLFYAINLRHNAIFAAAPIVFLIVRQWHPGLSTIKAMALMSVIIAASISAGNVLNYKVLGSVKTKPSNYMMVDDLFYLSIKKKESLIPEIPFADLQACATHEGGQTKLVGKVFCLSEKTSYKNHNPLDAELKSIWMSQIARNPFDYVSFRLSAFSYLLRSPSDPPFYIWHSGVDENTLGIKQEKNGMTLLVGSFVQEFAKLIPFAFKPYWWLWFGSLLLLITFAIKSSSSTRTAQALLISGVLYIAGYFPVTPMADFRYAYWSVIATTLAAALLIIDKAEFVNCTSLKKKLLLIVAALFSLIIFNLNKIVSVNIDAALAETLSENKQPVTAIPQHYYLMPTNEGYTVTGGDPQLIYNIGDMRLKGQDVKYLSFTFLCSGQQTKPSVQLFWWSDNQSGPSEKQSLVAEAQEGINIFPLTKVAESIPMHDISKLRLDLVDPNSCHAFQLADLSIYR